MIMHVYNCSLAELGGGLGGLWIVGLEGHLPEVIRVWMVKVFDAGGSLVGQKPKQ